MAVLEKLMTTTTWHFIFFLICIPSKPNYLRQQNSPPGHRTTCEAKVDNLTPLQSLISLDINHRQSKEADKDLNEAPNGQELVSRHRSSTQWSRTTQ